MSSTAPAGVPRRVRARARRLLERWQQRDEEHDDEHRYVERAGSTAPKLDWKRCDDGECATLAVPLDRDRSRPGSRSSSRWPREPAEKPDERIGSLLINPGGPGAPGTDFVKPVAAELPASITDRFDIVGWDPRGTGASAPVDCGKKLDYLFDVDTAPDDAGRAGRARRRVASGSRRRARRGSGDLLSHIASIDTVHDMDRIRAALGDEKLTYAGFSYGTYLGALYAAAVPGPGARPAARRCDRPGGPGRRGLDPAGEGVRVVARRVPRRTARDDRAASSTTAATREPRSTRCAPASNARPMRGRRRPDARPDPARHRARRAALLGRGGLQGPRARAGARPSTAIPATMLELFDDYVAARAERQLRGGVAGVPRDLLRWTGPTSIPAAVDALAGPGGAGGAVLRCVERRARACRARTGRSRR